MKMTAPAIAAKTSQPTRGPRFFGFGWGGARRATGAGANLRPVLRSVPQLTQITASAAMAPPQDGHSPLWPWLAFEEASLSFGLGSASIVDSITVNWPNAGQTSDLLTDVGVNQFVTVQEVCFLAGDPSNLMVDIDGDDVLLTWDDPSVPELVWNVYRDEAPDPAGWGGPLEEGVMDGDAGTPGIQYRDTGAVSVGSVLFYLTTAVNECGETPLR